jgi:threonine/homoserine/homoserine lactone efflux protein
LETLTIILVAFTATLIGALPFGLVNLTVMDVSYRKGTSTAMQIAHGASWIEVVFVLIAIFAGSFIGNVTKHLSWGHLLFAGLPVLVGLIFLFKKTNKHTDTKEFSNGFFKGIFLNLISMQVLLYWVLAMTIITKTWLTEPKIEILVLIIVTVWTGKMAVLWIYARLSKNILSKSNFLANNINRIIGAILILSGFLQFIK